MALQKIEIEQTTSGFRVRPVGNPQWQEYDGKDVKSIIPTEVIGIGVGIDNSNYRYDDMLTFAITFNEEDRNSLRYDVQDVENQAGWTANSAGLTQAIADIESWLASSGISVIASVISGNVQTPLTIAAVIDGSTPAGASSFSILFEGSGGSLNGVPVVSGYTNSKSATLGNTLASESYVVPTVADLGTFPNSPRVVISYTS